MGTAARCRARSLGKTASSRARNVSPSATDARIDCPQRTMVLRARNGSAPPLTPGGAERASGGSRPAGRGVRGGHLICRFTQRSRALGATHDTTHHKRKPPRRTSGAYVQSRCAAGCACHHRRAIQARRRRAPTAATRPISAAAPGAGTAVALNVAGEPMFVKRSSPSEV